MTLDRAFQLEIMKKMAEVYPAAYDFWTDPDYRDKENQHKLYTNLYYLQSHGLLEPKSIHFTTSLDGIGSWTLGNTRLNHKGMISWLMTVDFPQFLVQSRSNLKPSNLEPSLLQKL